MFDTAFMTPSANVHINLAQFWLFALIDTTKHSLAHAAGYGLPYRHLFADR